LKNIIFNNGDAMPALGLGTWKSAKGEVYQAIRSAIELGYRHFDCAYIYGNEGEIGSAFADAIKNNEVKREDLWITSKLWNNVHQKQYVADACQKTLDLLGLTYLDLYLIHWPVALRHDIGFPAKADELLSLKTVSLTETWSEMIKLKEIGKAKHIGVSNFGIKNLDKIIADTGVTPEVLQIEIHPFLQQNDLLAYGQKNNIILTAYCPLGSADRPANRIMDGEPKLFENEIIHKIAAEKQCTSAQIMLAWAVCRGTSVIPKSVNVTRLKENLEAADIELNADQMSQLASLNLDYRYIKGDFWCIEGSDYTLESLWE
jgi:alcohol dehydrogenase (NADP+)